MANTADANKVNDPGTIDVINQVDNKTNEIGGR